MIKHIAEKIGGRSASQMLIASLDLLGIRSLMFNASPEELGIIETEIALVQAMVMSQLSKTADKIKTRLTPEKFQSLTEICESIHYTFFSDTIIISHELSDLKKHQECSNDEWIYNTAIYFFLLAVKAATYNLMIRGFPIRGCIDTGAAIISKACAIGRPFVNSIGISETLEFSGVVFTQEALIVCREAIIGHELITPLELIVPTKRGALKMPCLDWTIPGFSSHVKDIDAFLRSQFCANGKLLSKSAIEKLKNTEQIVLAFIQHHT